MLSEKSILPKYIHYFVIVKEFFILLQVYRETGRQVQHWNVGWILMLDNQGGGNGNKGQVADNQKR